MQIENKDKLVRVSMTVAESLLSEFDAMIETRSMVNRSQAMSELIHQEIIQHKFNGLLVENYNPNVLSEAFNLFIENQSLYTQCKINTASSVNQFSIQKISKEWEELLGNML